MQPEENQVDPDRDSSAEGSSDSPSVPLPILLRVPWFPPETQAPAAAATSPEVTPPPEMSEPVSDDSTMPARAWRESAPPRRRWPVVAALAGCLCAIAIGAVVDEFWWSRPDVGRHDLRRSVSRSQKPAAAPASEIEPLLAIPSAARHEASLAVPRVSLAPDIVPLESGDEP